MAKSSCGFSEDFPALETVTNSYNRALYNHLRRINEKDQAMQAAFMELTAVKDESSESEKNEKSQHEMETMRKAMAKNS